MQHVDLVNQFPNLKSLDLRRAARKEDLLLLEQLTALTRLTTLKVSWDGYYFPFVGNDQVLPHTLDTAASRPLYVCSCYSCRRCSITFSVYEPCGSVICMLASTDALRRGRCCQGHHADHPVQRHSMLGWPQACISTLCDIQ